MSLSIEEEKGAKFLREVQWTCPLPGSCKLGVLTRSAKRLRRFRALGAVHCIFDGEEHDSLQARRVDVVANGERDGVERLPARSPRLRATLQSLPQTRRLLQPRRWGAPGKLGVVPVRWIELRLRRRSELYGCRRCPAYTPARSAGGRRRRRCGRCRTRSCRQRPVSSQPLPTRPVVQHRAQTRINLCTGAPRRRK